MSDGSLSQDEIDALLAGTDQLTGMGMGGGMTAPAATTDSLSDSEKNSFLDVMRGAIESACSSLSTVISTGVSAGMVKVDVMGPEEVRSELGGSLVQLNMPVQGSMSGDNSIIIPDSGAIAISNMTMGQSGEELTEMALNALSQTMSQMYGAAASSISAKIGKAMTFADAHALVAHANTELTLPGGGSLVRLGYSFKIDGQNPINVSQVMSFKLAKEFINSGGGIGADMNFGQSMGQQQPAFTGAMPAEAMGPAPGQVGVQSVQYPQLGAGAGAAQSPHNISMLMDVQMQLSVELGRTHKSISEILGFGEGSIIELDKLAGEPVDVLVNGKLIAKGEVVVIDENFGVRVTEIVSPKSRVDFGI